MGSAWGARVAQWVKPRASAQKAWVRTRIIARGFLIPLHSAAVSRVLGPRFPPPLNPVESRVGQVLYALTLTVMNPEI